MPRYTLYHAIDLFQMVYHDATQWSADRAAHYQRVAEVEADAEAKPLSQVFHLTNHIDERPWQENPAVVWHDSRRPLRSTSVGDVVVNSTTHEAWMVMPCGFKLLEGANDAASED